MGLFKNAFLIIYQKFIKVSIVLVEIVFFAVVDSI